MVENNIALSKSQMDTIASGGLDVSDASLIYMGRGQYNVNGNEEYFDSIIKCKLGFYTYNLQDLYRRIEDITMGCDYYMVIDRYSVQLQRINNDEVVHAETSENDDNMLESAYNMLIWCIENILHRKVTVYI